MDNVSLAECLAQIGIDVVFDMEYKKAVVFDGKG